MIELYYTGSDSYLGVSSKEKTLGGYISSTGIPNSSLGNLFSTISEYTKQNDIEEYKAIAIKNAGEVTIPFLNIYFDSVEDLEANFEVAAVEPAEDLDGGYYVEKLTNRENAPMNAEFYSIDGFDNSLMIEGFESGKFIVLWIRRKLSDSGKAIPSCDVIYNKYSESEEVSITEVKTIVFVIDFNPDESSSSQSSSS